MSEIIKFNGGVKTAEVLPPKKKELRKYLDKEVIVARILAMPRDKDQMLCMTLWRTGLRVSEVINIKKRDLDFNNRLMTVKWLKNRRWNERLIPLQKELGMALKMFTMRLKSDDLLFPYTRQAVGRITRKWIKCSPHQIRHSFAVNYLRQEGKIHDLKQLLGHSSFATTFEYLKIVPSDLTKELDKVDFG